jgi:hypothetical protein
MLHAFYIYISGRLYVQVCSRSTTSPTASTSGSRFIQNGIALQSFFESIVKILFDKVLYQHCEVNIDHGTYLNLIHWFIYMQSSTLVKVGAWGGQGGNPQDIDVLPERLTSMTIRSGDVIEAIMFTYVDTAGNDYTTDLWGGGNGSFTKVRDFHRV